jgi:hypothetical protein
VDIGQYALGDFNASLHSLSYRPAIAGHHEPAGGLGMPKANETFSRYDTADYLETAADMTAYLAACAQEDDPALLVAALGDMARARKALNSPT